jgi:NTE family protein
VYLSNAYKMKRRDFIKQGAILTTIASTNLLASNKKRVSLVLGSGGARGLAHFGVIEVLQELGFEIVAVSGCSIGSIIGVALCQGKLPALQEWAQSLNTLKVLQLFNLKLADGALLGTKNFQVLKDILGDAPIESFKIPFAAVATNITDGSEYVFTKGSSYDAFTASSSIPGVFPPYKLDGKELVDGGVLNPVPISHLPKVESDLVIAVNLNGEFDGNQTVSLTPTNTMQMVQTLSKSWEMCQNALVKAHLVHHKCDVLIDIPWNCAKFYEFNRVRELMELGRTVTRAKFNEIGFAV